MTKDPERIRIYEKIREELTQNQRSNAENFDKGILTLSSAGLGISVAFLDNIIKLPAATCHFLLYSSWVLFILTIITTLLSYIMGQKGIKLHLHFAHEYYLEEKESFLTKENRYAKFVDKYSSWTISFFISAIITLMLFIIINIHKGKPTMSDEQKKKLEYLIDSVTINDLQKVHTPDEKRSIPINNLQPVQKPIDTGSGQGSTNSEPKSSEEKK